MAVVSNPKIRRSIPIVLLIALFALRPTRAQSQDARPVADAGSSRYAAADPVQLDGTGSYDPDNSGSLSYTWRQIAGSSVEATDTDNATPTISGFTQTDEIQECEFELVVSDGEFTSLPDTVKVIIVPDFGADTLRQENPPFDPNKPTIIFFGGGNCITGGGGIYSPPWAEKANVISFPSYGPDPSVDNLRTYYRYGDMIIAYLSSVAPDYKLPIQTYGLSTGGQPAIDVGLRLNMMYQDARYAINRVSFLDATGYCREYSESISTFLTSSVDGEQCWIDNYVSTLKETHPSNIQYPGFHLNVLNVGFEVSKDRSLTWEEAHFLAILWYGNSLTTSDMNQFNNGVVAGAYWSVVGLGKNLQLASTPEEQTYKFNWYGKSDSGYMDFWDEPNHPGRLPEPVTLVGPEDGAIVDANGALLSCEKSENAVGYQLLFGSNPYRVMDYLIVSDTPSPPVGTTGEFPFEKTWWTVRAYDSFGSTIYADPRCLNAAVVSPPMMLPHVLYIYESDVEAAESFHSLLVDYGCLATLTALTDVATAPLDSYDLIIVADDTQSAATWDDPQTVVAIETSGKPVMGLGEGGYDFFGVVGLSIGRPNGMHDDGSSIYAIDPNGSFFSTPYPIDIPEDEIIQLYTESSLVLLYLWPVPETVTVLGGAVNQPGYYPLALENDRYLFWGFTESPLKMTEDGKRLFINTVIRTANKPWESRI